MSGFQIPGLGQAKPNETLPPLPAEVQKTTDDEGVEALAATQQQATDPQGAANNDSSSNPLTEQSEEVTEPAEAMVIDRPESPPSLTGALEAAIGGLGGATQTHEAPAQVQPAELQVDMGGHPEWEVDSSPYESSSDSSDSDSSDEDDSDNEGYELLGVEETARLLMEIEGGSEDEGDKSGKPSGSAQVRTKNEVPEEVVPKPDVTITPEMKIEELGSVEHMVENIAVIKAITPGEYQVLDTGSVLCNADRVVIGAVAETIGKVLQPMYTVRFTSAGDMEQLGLEIGSKVFYPVDHATYVFTEPLKSVRGSDASNLHDEEVGNDEMEFSDDEKEAEYKRSIKQKKKDKWKSPGGRGGREPHPLRQEMQPDGGLNYDDDDDGPYKPLARPPGYGSGPSSSEPVEPAPRSSFQRGRRGDFRGRGGRGRGSGRGGRGGFGQQPRDGYSLPPQGYSNAQAPPPPPTGTWSSSPGPTAPGQAPAPALPNFPFQIPGWPQPPAQAGVAGQPLPPPPPPPGWPSPPAQAGVAGQPLSPPPPPPGWPSQGQAQGQAGGNGAFANPAFLAALMGQMQQAQNGQPPWGGQHQPPQGGGGQ